MDEKELLNCAESAFAAIAGNIGKSYWFPGDGLSAAVTAFCGIDRASCVAGDEREVI
jgi:hypothetical protein